MTYIRQEMSEELFRVANMEQPEITFSLSVKKGMGKGSRAMFRVSSCETRSLSEKRLVETIRGEVWNIFEKHGFCVRLPQEDGDELHMTIRDERFETKISPHQRFNRPKIPSCRGNVMVVFDKLAITPAAECHARHSFSWAFSGATLCVNVFSEASYVSAPGERCFVEGTYFPSPDGSLVLVDSLAPQQIVHDCDGNNVEVLSVHNHRPEPRDLMWFEAGGTQLLVTADHRMVVRRCQRKSTLMAKDLREWQHIMSAQGEERISSACLFQTEASVYEVSFKHDPAMETFFCDGALLTKRCERPQSKRPPRRKEGQAKKVDSSSSIHP